jgi:hypothetical protein
MAKTNPTKQRNFIVVGVRFVGQYSIVLKIIIKKSKIIVKYIGSKVFQYTRIRTNKLFDTAKTRLFEACESHPNRKPNNSQPHCFNVVGTL